MKNICQGILSVSSKIQQALSKGFPIVALESTIISHGMPYPQNKECAQKIEKIIQSQGAVPATIGIMDGKIKIGLSESQIQRLAYEGPKVAKVSRRDIPNLIMTKGLGATTVSSTMIAAEMAGISVFVTGGIGGIHRGYQQTMDASADLRQLGRTPVTVVSAGVKSILDIPKTLEYLETQGVSVITYQSDYFPAFFSSSSGIKTPLRLNSPQEIASLIFQKERLNLQNGILVTVPNPSPAEGELIEKAIQQALKEADEQQIKGSKITPFLLKRVNEITKGKSLESNISLVFNNAEVGAKISSSLSMKKMEAKSKTKNLNLSSISSKSSTSANNLNKSNKSKVVVIGASAVDSQYRPLPGKQFELYKSCQGYSKRVLGGVARNIAEVCSRLQVPTTLITPLNSSPSSKKIENFCSDVGINLRELRTDAFNTAQYLTIMDKNNDEMIGISEMEINSLLTFDRIYDTYFKSESKNDSTSKIAIIDANVNHSEESLADLRKLLGMLSELGYFVVYECKGQKTHKIADPELLKMVSLLRMNKNEKQDLFAILRKKGHQISTEGENSFLGKTIGANTQSTQVGKLCQAKALITNKSLQIETISQGGQPSHHNVLKSQNVKKTTGAGDSLTGGLVSYLLKGKPLEEALIYGMAASRLSIETVNSQSVISDQISPEKLDEMVRLTL